MAFNPGFKHVFLLMSIVGLCACGGSSSSSSESGPNTQNTATLTWSAPLVRADDSALSPSELGGYKIYIGSTENDLRLLTTITDASITEYTVTNLANGTHYFAVSAFDADEMESDLTAIGSKTF